MGRCGAGRVRCGCEGDCPRGGQKAHGGLSEVQSSMRAWALGWEGARGKGPRQGLGLGRGWDWGRGRRLGWGWVLAGWEEGSEVCCHRQHAIDNPVLCPTVQPPKQPTRQDNETRHELFTSRWGELSHS